MEIVEDKSRRPVAGSPEMKSTWHRLYAAEDVIRRARSI